MLRNFSPPECGTLGSPLRIAIIVNATTEGGFSAMKLYKTRLRNKMADGFLADILVVYIEKEIAEKFDLKSVIEEFKNVQGRRAEL
ncbi:hypothetical protein LXL04_033446 [Taraxacum kok-saghyz]